MAEYNPARDYDIPGHEPDNSKIIKENNDAAEQEALEASDGRASLKPKPVEVGRSNMGKIIGRPNYVSVVRKWPRIDISICPTANISTHCKLDTPILYTF